MTIEQLRIFLAVAELEHVTQAANRLNLTQSAVSAAMSRLQDQHGVALFDRVGRNIILNAAGRSFLPEARRILSEVRRAETMLSDLSGKPSGELRISASQTVASYWLPAIMVRYCDAFPEVQLHLRAGNTATVEQDVRRGRADIGIVEGRASEKGLLAEVVASDRLALIIGPEHPWSDGRRLSMADLPRTTWIMRESGSGTRAVFEEELQAAGYDPSELKVTMELPSNEACLAAVGVGRSATVLSIRAAQSELSRGELCTARLDLELRHFTMLRLPVRHMSLAVQELVAELHRQIDMEELQGDIRRWRRSSGHCSPWKL